MSIATELLAVLQAYAERAPLPRIRALHLPPPEAARRDTGEFCAVELEDGSFGLSYVLLDDTLARLYAGGAARLAGSDALALARHYAHGQGVMRTLGFAAVNALSASLMQRAGYSPDSSSDSLGQLDPAPGEAIGMIGLFRPLLPRLLAAGARLTVVELKAELAGEYDGYRVTLDPAALADCPKVLATSTMLLNDTLEAMLAHARAARWFALVGPTAGCLPDPLFARGITRIGGTRVVNGPAFAAALTRGERWSEHAYKYTLTPDNWPGVKALLAQVGKA